MASHAEPAPIVAPTASPPPTLPEREALARQMMEATGELSRHPGDGWIMADPAPLSPALVRKFHGLIRAMCPPEPRVPDLEARIEDQVRRMMRYMQPLIVMGFKAALHVLDLAPVWRGKSLKRLQDLPPDVGARILTEVERARLGPISDMVSAARAAVLAPYYDLDEVLAHIGYTPVEFMRRRVALRRRLAAGEAALDGDHIGPYAPGLRADNLADIADAAARVEPQAKAKEVAP